jgi:hypothetical protein
MWTSRATAGSTPRRTCGTYREGGKVRNQTVANLSALPEHVIDWIDAGLKGRQLVPVEQAVSITRSLPHGHVAAVTAMAHKLGLPGLLGLARTHIWGTQQGGSIAEATPTAGLADSGGAAEILAEPVCRSGDDQPSRSSTSDSISTGEIEPSGASWVMTSLPTGPPFSVTPCLWYHSHLASHLARYDGRCSMPRCSQ